MIKPENSCNNICFYPLPECTALDIVFGLDETSFFDRDNLPEVPQEYLSIAEKLFFEGGVLPEFNQRIDRQKAIRAIKAMLGSFSPAHEAKIATVGYALWLWTSNAIDNQEAA